MRPTTTTIPLLLAALLLLPACVTERISPSRGTPVLPTPAHAARPAPSLPSGPIATPLTDAASTTSSHVTVAIKPLGQLPYDGVSIPLTSPDGRHIAVQQGLPPSWDALFAYPDAEPPLASRIGIYRITDTALEPIPVSLPDGLILGRSADDRGFLVESPRADGSRWIGYIPWPPPSPAPSPAPSAAPHAPTPINPTWLVQTPDLSSHAVLTPSGDLAFSRRPVGGGTPSLVWRRAGTELALPFPEAAQVVPVSGADPDALALLIATPDALEVAAVTLAPLTPDPQTPPAPLAVGPRRTIAASGLPAILYQTIAPLQTPLPPLPATTPTPPATATPQTPLFLTARQRMALFSATSAEVTPLLPDSIAAVPAAAAEGEPRGYLVSVPRGLVFLPVAGQGLANHPTPRPDLAASIVTGAYVPRITSRPGYVTLFAPAPNAPRPAYEVSVMILGVPADR